jgi:2-oxo-4-hydroxy-4-carboxy--5-ureidoimidazoline (OHCU) decarboxylase
MATAPLRPTAEELAPLFEGAPAFLARVCAAGPFASEAELFATARAIAHAMPEPEQLELIDAHPRLGAPPGTVSAMSYVEQGYDRVAATGEAGVSATGATPDGAGATTAATVDVTHAATPIDVATELERLNDAYEARFGFRYCVFVAGRPREALLPGFAAAVQADRDSERRRALDAVVDIAIDRYRTVAATTADASR